MDKSLAVVIGRFQGFHHGHRAVIAAALAQHERVAVLVGTTGCAATVRDPFTFEQVAQMIKASFRQPSESGRIEVLPLLDDPYDDLAWADEVRHKALILGANKGVTLYGHKKDASSYYLDLFPEWNLRDMPNVGGYDATAVRRRIFKFDRFSLVDVMPAGAAEVVMGLSDEFMRRMKQELAAVEAHDAHWHCHGTQTWGVQHVAVDAMAVHPERGVLLIRRGGKIGHDTIALPGGHVNAGERLLPAALREFKEEVGISLMVAERPGPSTLVCFDHPRRSLTGQTFTHLLMVGLSDAQADAAVAGDDAKEIVWARPKEIDGLRGQFFSDHFHIVKFGLRTYF